MVISRLLFVPEASSVDLTAFEVFDYNHHQLPGEEKNMKIMSSFLDPVP